MHRTTPPCACEPLEARLFLSTTQLTPAAKHKKHKAKPAPEITLLQNGKSLAAAASTIDFGSAIIGTSGITRTFIIRNDGAASLSISHLKLPAGFSLIDAPAGHLAAAGQTTFTLRMETRSLATRTGQLTFTTNDADEKNFDITLRGTIVAKPSTPPSAPPPAPTAALITVWLTRPSRSSIPISDNSSTPIDFAPCALNDTPSTRTFRIANEGTATLNLGAVQLPTGFRLLDPLNTSIAPGQADDLTIALDTSSIGTHTGQLTFTTSDSHAPIFNFPLTGAVSAPPPQPATPASQFAGGTLTINGTPGDDTLLFSGHSSALTVTLNGKLVSGSPFANVTKIVINAGDGNDRIDLSPLYLNATANGGPGSDTLIGSNADDVLNGEDGNDSLLGNDGDDFLLGGDGNDTLLGGGGIDSFTPDAGTNTIDAIDGLADAQITPGSASDVIRKDRIDPLS